MVKHDLIDRAVLPTVRIEIPKRLDDETTEILSKVVEAIYNVIQSAPTVDAEPVRHGEWIFDNGVDYCYKCSECKAAKPPHYITDNYCPNCGAKMEG